MIIPARTRIARVEEIQAIQNIGTRATERSTGEDRLQHNRSLNPAQQKYCTTRRELLAVVATLDHFKGYVWGPHFTIRTDHAALVWLTNLKNIQGMLARWLAKLQQFHFSIEHRPGAQHGNADGLTRCPQCERGSCAPIANTHNHDPNQPYANSCGGSSMES